MQLECEIKCVLAYQITGHDATVREQIPCSSHLAIRTITTDKRKKLYFNYVRQVDLVDRSKSNSSIVTETVVNRFIISGKLKHFYIMLKTSSPHLQRQKLYSSVTDYSTSTIPDTVQQQRYSEHTDVFPMHYSINPNKHYRINQNDDRFSMAQNRSFIIDT